jgi:hypothetical protein
MNWELRTGLLYGVVMSGTLACEQGRPESVEALTRDSAGVAIVESPAPTWGADGVAWTIDATPQLRVGAEDGNDVVVWFRLTAARLLPDGQIVVANAGSGELRFFGTDGSFVRSVGRTGQGPGEFAQTSSLRLCLSGDGRILVEDQGNSRINVYSFDGQFLRTVRLSAAEEEGRPPSLIGCSGDGRFLGVSPVGGGALQGNPGDVIKIEADYVSISEAGEVLARLVRLTRPPRFVHEVNGVISYPFLPLYPQASVTGGEDAVYVASGASSEVRKISETGELKAIYRWSNPQPRQVRSIWGQFVEESLQRIERDDQRQRYRRFYDQPLPLPELVPAIQALTVDTEGNVWAERYRLPWEAERLWDVLGPTGRWLGSVQVPHRTQVLEIGPDYLMGRHVNEYGVERLVVHAILKNSVDGGRE